MEWLLYEAWQLCSFYTKHRDHLDIILIPILSPQSVTRTLALCARTERTGSDLKVTQLGQDRRSRCQAQSQSLRAGVRET